MQPSMAELSGMTGAEEASARPAHEGGGARGSGRGGAPESAPEPANGSTHQRESVAPPRLEMPRNRFYKARGAALALWKDRSPELLLSGPAGSGKSRGVIEKLNACALRFPGMRGLIVRKTRESLTESALVTYEDMVLPEGSKISRGAKRRLRQAYHYPNGSTLVLGGMDKASRIMSTQFDLVYVQEATELEENDWESLTTRLRNAVMPFQQIIGDCNPESPQHWLYRRCLAGRTVMHESRHEDNPRLWDEATGDWTLEGRDYLARLDLLTGPRRDRLRFGRWVQAEGVVYEGWDRTRHLVDREFLPPYFSLIFASVDWGFTHAGVILVWGVDYDGRMYLLKEIHQSKKLIGWWVERAGELVDTMGVSLFVCDPSEPAYILQFRQAGLAAIAANNEIIPGIAAVQERLKVAEDGRARLYVVRDSLEAPDPILREARRPVSLVEEMDGYVWARAAHSTQSKELPIKVDDDALDSARYAVMHMERVAPAPDPVPFGPTWQLKGMLAR